MLQCRQLRLAVVFDLVMGRMDRGRGLGANESITTIIKAAFSC